MDTKSPIPEDQINSVSDLVAKVAKLYVGNDTVIFRGQRDRDWNLKPKLSRLNLRLRYSESLLSAERQMLADFQRLAVARISGLSTLDKWDLLALAQHHGMPTRLLDWTSNPLVALWFAVEVPAEKRLSAVVWTYDTDVSDYVTVDQDPYNLSRTMIFKPRHHDSRIVAQAGCFSVHNFSDLSDSFSKFDSTNGKRNQLRKFVIPADRFAPIREELSRYGISRASLFPDLAGLCGFISWKYDKLSDEEGHDIYANL